MPAFSNVRYVPSRAQCARLKHNDAYLFLTPISTTETVLSVHSVLFEEETTISREHLLPAIGNRKLYHVCVVSDTRTRNSQ